MAFDYKKEYREFYLPKNKPALVTVPPMQYLAVRGSGDPNEPNGDYQTAVGALYAVAYTVKMSKLGEHRMEGYFDFVVPPLEGFWWQNGVEGVDYGHKERFQWWAVIRVPEFVTEDELRWAASEAARKKKLDCARVELRRLEEGLCVQCLHVGPFDAEPETVAQMHRFAAEQGYEPDFSGGRLHHEIYLSDPRKCAPERMKTVIRVPVRRTSHG